MVAIKVTNAPIINRNSHSKTKPKTYRNYCQLDTFLARGVKLGAIIVTLLRKDNVTQGLSKGSYNKPLFM
ncbi:MAG: hypothetical protein CMH96_03060 [Oceanospirillaceae bacterium]|jgi:hypothetical protein|nr:hypothetical protein [Oceanospirillaceae bacterium]